MKPAIAEIGDIEIADLLETEDHRIFVQWRRKGRRASHNSGVFMAMYDDGRTTPAFPAGGETVRLKDAVPLACDRTTWDYQCDCIEDDLR